MSSKATKNEALPSKEPRVNSDEFGFMIECMKNIDGGHNVDLTKVANALGYSNVASVGNKYRQLRKKYGINLGCVTGSGILTAKMGKDTTAPAAGGAVGEQAAAVNNNSAIESNTTAVTPAVASKVPVAKKPRARKGAKVSSAPIPAMVESDSQRIAGLRADFKAKQRRKDTKKVLEHVDALEDAIEEAVRNVNQRYKEEVDAKAAKHESDDDGMAVEPKN